MSASGGRAGSGSRVRAPGPRASRRLAGARRVDSRPLFPHSPGVTNEPAAAGVAASWVAPWPARLRVPAVILCGLLGGVLFGIHVQDTKAAPLGWISTVPWLLLATHPRLQGRGNGWAFAAGMHLMTLIGLYWLRGQNTPTWLIAPLLYWPLMLPLYFAPRAIRARWPSFPLALLWPLVYVGVEWMRIRLSPGELALCVLGYSQVVFTKLIQVADLAGVSAVSFWLAAWAGLMAELVIQVTTPGSWRSRARRLAPQAVAVTLLLGAVLAYGVARDSEATFRPGPTFHVIQPALPRSQDYDTAIQIYEVQVVMTLSTAKPGEVDAILWPENAIMAQVFQKGGGFHEYLGPDLFNLAARLRAPILVDGPSADPATGKGYHSALFLKPDGDYEVYDKVMLLPWTEYVPFRGVLARFGQGAVDAWLGFVRKFVGFTPDAEKGRLEDVRAFHLRTRSGEELKFGTPICFEVATPRVVNRWHRQGADFLVNQTSEGKLGDSIHPQTITVCGFRAVEGRVSVVRATNDGISAWIDPNGRVREVLRGRETGSPINEPGSFHPTIVLDSRKGTFYALHGDWLAVACLVVAALLWAEAIHRQRRRRREQAA